MLRRKRATGWATGWLVLVLLVALNSVADARSRTRPPRTVPAVLRPLLFARSAVHAVADPIVFNAPRAVATIASAPIRVAYQSARGAKIYDAPEVDRDEVDEAQPAELAYHTLRVRRPAPPPRAERAEPLYDDDGDEPRKVDADEEEEKFTGGSKPMVSGSRAVIRNGIAYAPSSAPPRVKNAIWASNSLRRKPYIWGGGHGSFNDRGYDCSGTVSFALHHAGVLGAPLPSSDLMRFGDRGGGRWITIYSRPGHTFAVIAGLRLDTTDFDIGGNVGPRWHADARDTSGYIARHPAGL
jgi:cell wall-associated NlpC family hydrolase